MIQNNWNDWYSGWGWILWFGIVLLLFSSAGNWGYSYRVHRKYASSSGKSAIEILNERYAKGEIQSKEYGQIKSDMDME